GQFFVVTITLLCGDRLPAASAASTPKVYVCSQSSPVILAAVFAVVATFAVPFQTPYSTTPRSSFDAFQSRSTLVATTPVAWSFGGDSGGVVSAGHEPVVAAIPARGERLPNPSRASTSIRYRCSQSSLVSVAEVCGVSRAKDPSIQTAKPVTPLASGSCQETERDVGPDALAVRSTGGFGGLAAPALANGTPTTANTSMKKEAWRRRTTTPP